MQNNKVYSDKQEKSISKFLGWKQVSGSGARPLHPGDIVSEYWLGECKTHTSRCELWVFHFDVWAKICEEAQSQFKHPVLFVDNGTQTIENTLCLVDITQSLGNQNLLKDIPDYSSKSSLRVNEIVNMIIQYKSQYLAVMPLQAFKVYSEIGE